MFLEKNCAGGSAGDTIDLSVVFTYKAKTESAIRTQTVEEETEVDDDAQYMQYKTVFLMDYDLASHEVTGEDVICIRINLETDTSECDDVYINHAIFMYQTKTLGFEIP